MLLVAPNLVFQTGRMNIWKHCYQMIARENYNVLLTLLAFNDDSYILVFYLEKKIEKVEPDRLDFWTLFEDG